jgi:hypothetical protein
MKDNCLAGQATVPTQVRLASVLQLSTEDIATIGRRTKLQRHRQHQHKNISGIGQMLLIST